VIRYKLREEKQGGYLFDCRRGSARQISTPEFDFLNALADSQHWLTDGPRTGIEQYFAENVEAGQQWWLTLEKLGLTQKARLEELQIIRLDAPPTRLPDDCRTAPARVYFELTRRCNLVCRSCFNNSQHPLANELSTQEI